MKIARAPNQKRQGEEESDIERLHQVDPQGRPQGRQKYQGVAPGGGRTAQGAGIDEFDSRQHHEAHQRGHGDRVDYEAQAWQTHQNHPAGHDCGEAGASPRASGHRGSGQ